MLKKIRESYSMRLIAAVTLLNLISIIIISILFYFTLHGTVNKNYKKITDDMAVQVQSEMSRRLDELKKNLGTVCI